MEISLRNQVAIVTGASSGIGSGIAKSLAAAGAAVVVNHSSQRSLEEAQAVLKEITDAGGKGITYQCDVSKEDQVIAMFQDVVSQLGTVDILVNNAGIQKDAQFTEMTIDQWNAVIGVNLTGQFLCAREAVKEFLRRGIDPSRSIACGKIIHISSVHEIIPWAGHANYASSKGAVRMLMQTLAQEYGADRIRVNSICPGAIQTPINKGAWETPEALNALLTLIPYNRIGQPQDIGNLAAFLASDLADYITGTSIFVDGGMTTFESFSTGG
ncbi:MULTISPECIES: glucose 1-dehydrogenase [Chryseobacterium]|jgi:glucose 1-dehydrogenase|uniref:SDR family NAD(P)-dependent oxidoreductase n=1 Tax=Chryseobacterium rhizosphaerae TaxID=395937 RepID=A0ABX9IFK0_9FLAO|nr:MULTISPECIES: glucose 1-dehydrogenase [Chryseobacterium]MDC8101570.1 glucose 1-dehydrogenase [Chryseobacterium rhizosphaerae]MDR6544203.1 glucose 1-dehydrogenase [Chryseobacterium rhizosphaerae]REC71990.1 SDR family NAD(P)-dependent oxidoreductase [Chryseobacterium rhizosphaerae]SMC86180.1 glucose 1-dehydrogenase [Chryseobacterium sp. YR221]GEN69112.1 glucose-1-dehydrogenase [Chryseobacterium rhizosphaerae]